MSNDFPSTTRGEVNSEKTISSQFSHFTTNFEAKPVVFVSEAFRSLQAHSGQARDETKFWRNKKLTIENVPGLRVWASLARFGDGGQK
jgi:hypothetical protein